MQDQTGTSHEGESRDIKAITLYITGSYITKVHKALLALTEERLLQNRFKF
jgi:hypothetical protein